MAITAVQDGMWVRLAEKVLVRVPLTIERPAPEPADRPASTSRKPSQPLSAAHVP